MLERASAPAERSLGDLLRDLAEGSAQRIRQEWELATLELYALGKEIGRGAAEIAVAGVCFALGGVSVLTGTALAFADPWVRVHAAIVIGIDVVVLGGVVAWLAKEGIRSLVEADAAGEKRTEIGTWRNQRPKYATRSS